MRFEYEEKTTKETKRKTSRIDVRSSVIWNKDSRKWNKMNNHCKKMRFHRIQSSKMIQHTLDHWTISFSWQFALENLYETRSENSKAEKNKLARLYFIYQSRNTPKIPLYYGRTCRCSNSFPETSKCSHFSLFMILENLLLKWRTDLELRPMIQSPLYRSIPVYRRNEIYYKRK